MRPRPLAITVIAWVFLAVGAAGIGRALWDLRDGFVPHEWGPMVLSGIIAVAGALLLLRGHPVGRWLLVVWMAAHLILGGLHDVERLVVHAVLFAPVVYCLFVHGGCRRWAGGETGAPRGRDA